MRFGKGLTIVAMGLSLATAVAAQERGFSGRLLLTGGVNTIEGAAGGGLTPWAVIGGYGTRDQFGGNAFLSHVEIDDYRLEVQGVVVGLFDRLELSYARQRFDTRQVGAALGLGAGFTIRQEVFGAKLRLAGDAVLDQDRWLPQLALGLEHKRNNRGGLLRAIGARDDEGTDVYFSATKLFLGQSMLLNATLRATKANQTGILGFGGDRRDSYRLEPELSVAYLLNRHLAVGGEYRFKPNNLGIAREDDWWDLFLAWAPNKHLTLTLAYVDLGNVVIRPNQSATYLSLQVGF
jgi:hypothetical protein